MKVIVGLGNPGQQYQNTRHNVGFMMVDAYADAHQLVWKEEKNFEAMVATGHIQDEKVMLVKPLTYMNLSGRSVQAITRYYHIDEEELLVISDDLDLAVGRIRLRQKGSSGGHNGLKSIMSLTQWQSFKRLRLGIGRPNTGQSIPDYVLGMFGKDDIQQINNSQAVVVDALDKWVETDDFTIVMNQFNKKGD